MADPTQQIQAIRQELTSVQSDLARAEAEESVRAQRRDKLVAALHDTYGLTLDDAPQWADDRDAEAAKITRQAEGLVAKAKDGARRIRRAQAGEAVDLSDLVPPPDDKLEDGELP